MQGWARLRDLKTGKEKEIRIEPGKSAKLLRETFSSDSCLAWALLDARPGDRISLSTKRREFYLEVIETSWHRLAREQGPEELRLHYRHA
jgi:transcription elongation GreA/GreB family factor